MSCFIRFLLLGCCFIGCAASAQGVHDYEALPEARLLLNPKAVTGNFPKGIDGRPDWVQTLGKGLIAPRATKTGESRSPEGWGEMPAEGIVFSNTQFMPFVVFPHQPHAEWLACSNCHEALFQLKATGKGKGMTAILRGEHCGFCHGRVAFSPEGSCYRCHSKPNPAAVQNNSPFVMPTKVEPVALPEEEEDKPRRRGAKKPVFSSGRLVPSIILPPAQPAAPIPERALE